MSNAVISVIIPTFNAGKRFQCLIETLKAQTLRPAEIVVVDSDSADGTAALAKTLGCRTIGISRDRFNHGDARNLGARATSGNILVFLTQDAIPCDDQFLKRLTRRVISGEAIAAYARQVPNPSAAPTEVFLRLHNYPDRPSLSSLADVRRRGVGAVMFSNVASAISRNGFDAAGGFDNVITHEDMLFCAKVLQRGFQVAYESDARVYHSHSYSCVEHFKRYFDMGAFMADHRQRLGCSATSRDGWRFSVAMFRYLWQQHFYRSLWPGTLELTAKCCGHQLGLHHWWLPTAMKRRLSRLPSYWRVPDCV